VHSRRRTVSITVADKHVQTALPPVAKARLPTNLDGVVHAARL